MRRRMECAYKLMSSDKGLLWCTRNINQDRNMNNNKVCSMVAPCCWYETVVAIPVAIPGTKLVLALTTTSMRR
jgi:hypothetical protein